MTLAPWLLALAPSLLWGGAAVVALMARQTLRRVKLVSFVVVAASCAAFVGAAFLGHGQATVQTLSEWIPIYHTGLRLRLDPLSLPFALTVLGVTLAVMAYAWGYYRKAPAAPHLLYALLLAFVAAMLSSCLANDVLFFFIFWESMLVASFLLLIQWGEGERVQSVSISYFVLTQAGSLLILAVLAWLTIAAGTSSLSDIGRAVGAIPPAQRTTLAIALLIGFGVKLAVVPLHIWLPDAHTIAPMPVTVLLAAAMLSMGAYGMVRFAIMLLGVATIRPLEPYLLAVALVSQVYGAIMCFLARDIKRIVAYSSVSQMGYVLFGLATLSSEGIAGGIMHVLNHGVLKAVLFMSVGMIIQSTGRRRITEVGGLGKVLPGIAATVLITGVAMAGLPPFAAFHSEWLILSGGLNSGYPVAGYIAFLTPLLTAGYGLWLGLRVSLGQSPVGAPIQVLHPATRWTAYGLLALSVVEDLAPGPLYKLAQSAAALILAGAGP